MAWRWTRWQTVKHQYFDLLALVGLRDRLRCPKCTAVGTWKPHGGWVDKGWDAWTGFKKTLRPGVRYATERRWVCKYCGYVRWSGGENQAYPNSKKGVWDEKCDDSTLTPKQAVETVLDKVWPWRG